MTLQDTKFHAHEANQGFMDASHVAVADVHVYFVHCIYRDVSLPQLQKAEFRRPTRNRQQLTLPHVFKEIDIISIIRECIIGRMRMCVYSWLTFLY